MTGISTITADMNMVLPCLEMLMPTEIVIDFISGLQKSVCDDNLPCSYGCYLIGLLAISLSALMSLFTLMSKIGLHRI